MRHRRVKSTPTDLNHSHKRRELPQRMICNAARRRAAGCEFRQAMRGKAPTKKPRNARLFHR
jgi:hypothetical protein